MTARTFKYENRLAKTLNYKKGLTLTEAVTAADGRLVELRERTLDEIDATVAEIQALAQDIKRLDDPRVQDIYAAANRINAIAGVFERTEMGEAAYSLCELIHRFQAAGRFSWPMVEVHLDGLRLLRHPDDHADDHRTQVLSGLRQVAASVC